MHSKTGGGGASEGSGFEKVQPENIKNVEIFENLSILACFETVFFKQP